MSEFFDAISANNAYLLTVGTRNDFSDGQIRIEPPATFDSDYLDMLSSDYGVTMEPWATGQEASLYTFAVDHGALLPTVLGNRERVEGTVSSLLLQLGYLSSTETFRETY